MQQEYKKELKEYLSQLEAKVTGGTEFFKAIVIGIDFDEKPENIVEKESGSSKKESNSIRDGGGNKEDNSIIDSLEDDDPFEDLENFYD